MIDTKYNLNFEKLCEELGIGNLIGEPIRVFGGLLHRMYEVRTDKARFAVKALNPQIMKRPHVSDHLVYSELVSKQVSEHGINAVSAMEFNGKILQRLEEQYFLIYPWVEGKMFTQNVISTEKCIIMGKILAELHRIDFDLISKTTSHIAEVSYIDWQAYEERLQNIGIQYSDYCDMLYKIEKLSKSAISESKNKLVISHRDLDQKNVLWNAQNNPFIIDWESAGIVNPGLELLEVALYWSGGEVGVPNKECFLALIDSYFENGGLLNEKLKNAVYMIFEGKLGWLEYNIKRSLGIEVSSKEEQELGFKQVGSTLESITKSYQFIPTLIDWIESR